MKFSKVFISACLTAIFSFTANATLVEFAATTSVTGGFSGGVNVDYAFTEVDADNKAMASLSDTDYLPILKVKAKSSDSGRATAIASTLQKYTYSGSVATNFTLNYNLHGSKVADYNSRLYGRVGVILGDNVAYSTSWGWGTNFYEGGGLTDDNEILSVDFLSLPDGVNQNVIGQTTFDIQPGESFFLYSHLEAYAYNGYIDAWNTFTMSFTDSTGLTAASFTPPLSSIPEPSSFILLLSALALFSSRKAKQS